MLFTFALASLLDQPVSSFMYEVRTSTLAIDLCRSIFDVNIVDIVEDILARPAYQKVAQLLLQEPAANVSMGEILPEVATVQDLVLGFSPLEYVIRYLPQTAALRLLRNGEDASKGAPLSAAAWQNDISLVKPLLDSGANVNAADHAGWTTLHTASHGMYSLLLETVVAHAHDGIDWQARTREGKNALQLAKESPFLDARPPSECKRVFAILREHISDDDDDDDEHLEMPGAFPQYVRVDGRWSTKD